MKNIHVLAYLAYAAGIFWACSDARAADWAKLERRSALFKSEEGRSRYGVLPAGTPVEILEDSGRRIKVRVERNGRTYRGFVSARSIGASFERDGKRGRASDKFRVWVYGAYQYHMTPEAEVELTSGQQFALSSFTETKSSYQLSLDYRLSKIWLFRLSYFPRNLVLSGTSSVVLSSSTSTPQQTTRTLEMTTIEASFRNYSARSSRFFYEFGGGMSSVSAAKLEFEDGTSEETDPADLSSKYSLFLGLGYTFPLGGGFVLDASANAGMILNNTPKIMYGRALVGLGYLF